MTPPLGLMVICDFARSQRLGGIEFPIDHFFGIENLDEGMDTIKCIQDSGLRVFLDIEKMDVDYISELVPRLERVGIKGLRVKMKHIGTTFYGGNRYSAQSFVTSVQNFRNDLSVLRKVLHENGVFLAIENHQDLHSSELVKLCNEGEGTIGVTWDIGNSVAVIDTPDTFLTEAETFVRNVHLKDYRIRSTDNGISLSRCPIGQGFVDIAWVLSKVLSNKNVSNISIELGAQYPRKCDFLLDEYWTAYNGVKFDRDNYLDYVTDRIDHSNTKECASQLSMNEDDLVYSEFMDVELSVSNISSVSIDGANE